MERYHIPVLQEEVLEYLEPKSNENFIDATIGEGGHTDVILERTAPAGKVLGIDFQLRLKPKTRLILAESNFANLKSIADKHKFERVQGILFDLGMSSWHLERSGKGFSFKRKEPLDMRYSPLNNLIAEKIINYWSRPEIERILREYGEEKKAKKIAERIIEARAGQQIKMTSQLVKIITSFDISLQRTFQALRIAVNDELNNLKIALPQAMSLLKPGGRLVVISFHSLEDRIVKNFFKDNFQKGQLKILTKKPIRPKAQEIKINPRSRSAKLRACQRI